MSALRRAILLALPALALLGLPASSQAAVTCELTGSELLVAMSAGGDEATLEVETGQIVVEDDSPAPVSCSGGPPTVNTVDRVEVVDRSGVNTTVVLNQLNDDPYPFAPGASGAGGDAGEGTKEIEISVALRRGSSDEFAFINWVRLRLGTDGLNPNAGPAEVRPDPDVFVRGAERISGDGAGGDDIFDARASACCGGPFPLDTDITGGVDEDRVFGGAGDDELSGDTGDDIIAGGNGNDLLEGDRDADVLKGGRGLDTVAYDDDTGVEVTIGAGNGDDGNDEDGLEGQRDTVAGDVEGLIGTEFADRLVGSGSANVLRGREGADVLLGLGRNDLLRAADGAADARIACGPGRRDRAIIDRGLDPRPLACERVKRV